MSLKETMQAIADALEPVSDEIVGLQILPYWTTHASPPCIDIYPAPVNFQSGSSFGVHGKRVWFVVRARASLADEQAANDILLRLLDPSDPASVEQALAVADTATIDNDRGIVNGFTQYADSPEMIGCDWTVGVWL